MPVATPPTPSRVLPRPKFKDILTPADVTADLWEGSVVQPKLDGQWGQLVIPPVGDVEIWSRHGRVTTTKEFGATRAECAARPVSGETVIHGEFMHGSNWAIKHDRVGEFHAFDCTVLDGVSIEALSLERRLQITRTVVGSLRFGGLDWMRTVETLDVSLSAAINVWQRVLDEDFEGLVFKTKGGAWGEGWSRLKRTYTIDYVVMGFNPGGGKYKGTVGSIKAGLMIDGELVESCNVGGITDAQREDFNADPDTYIGAVFEANGKGLFDSGALRHPNFLRWRDDKTPADCTWTKPIGA